MQCTVILYNMVHFIYSYIYLTFVCRDALSTACDHRNQSRDIDFPLTFKRAACI